MESKLYCIEFGWMKGKANCEHKLLSDKELLTLVISKVKRALGASFVLLFAFDSFH